jgi:hypothetical protein
MNWVAGASSTESNLPLHQGAYVNFSFRQELPKQSGTAYKLTHHAHTHTHILCTLHTSVKLTNQCSWKPIKGKKIKHFMELKIQQGISTATASPAATYTESINTTEHLDAYGTMGTTAFAE